MFLSIIVPVHNVEEYLQDCIESLLDQKNVDYEILLIENASTDNSLEICKRYENDPKVSVYSLEESGVSNARNFGLVKAVGEYIWFVDSDDMIAPNSIDYLQEKVRRLSDPDVLIFTHDEIVDGKKGAPRLFPCEEAIDKISALNGLFNAKLWSGFVWNKLIKNKPEILARCPFPNNIHMIEDLVFTTRLFISCNSFAVSNQCLYSYRKRQGSISNTFSEKKLSAFDAYELILHELGDLKEYSFAKKIINNAKVDFSRQILDYYYQNDLTTYKKVGRHYKRIIIENFGYITTFRAKIAALLVLVTPKLLKR